MSTTPPMGILDQLGKTGSAIIDALRARYLAGPPQGAPSAGPGSVLDNRNAQLQPLLPPQQPLVAAPAVQLQAPPTGDAYGTHPGEKRIDVSEYQKPLGGLSGVKRSK